MVVFEHVFDPFYAVFEIRHLVRSDGRVIIAVPNHAGIKRRINLLFGSLPVTSSKPSFSENALDRYHLHISIKQVCLGCFCIRDLNLLVGHLVGTSNG